MKTKNVAPPILILALMIGMIIVLKIPIPSETHSYTGTLISYEPHDLLHGGYLSPSTVLRFDDGASFTVDGIRVYMLGIRYTVNYEQVGSVIKVTSVTSTNEPNLPTPPILLKCYDLENIYIIVSQIPTNHTVAPEYLSVSSNYSELYVRQQFPSNSKILFTFLWTNNVTVINSVQLELEPSYILQWNQTSSTVHVF
jgi:hypothetical protein